MAGLDDASAVATIRARMEKSDPLMDEPTWTREWPTRAGFYWLRTIDDKGRVTDEIVKVYKTTKFWLCRFQAIRESSLLNESGEWLGPLEPPE